MVNGSTFMLTWALSKKGWGPIKKDSFEIKLPRKKRYFYLSSKIYIFYPLCVRKCQNRSQLFTTICLAFSSLLVTWASMSSLGDSIAKYSKAEDHPLLGASERTFEVESGKYSLSSFASTRLPISTFSGQAEESFWSSHTYKNFSRFRPYNC